MFMCIVIHVYVYSYSCLYMCIVIHVYVYMNKIERLLVYTMYLYNLCSLMND